MFKTVLVAKRSEAAARVARTCRQLDIKAVGLRASDDESGVHIDGSDETIQLELDSDGAFPVDEIIRAAKQAKADAVHMGYASADGQSALREAIESEGFKVIGTNTEALHRPDRFRDVAEKATGRIVPETIDRARTVGVLVAADQHGNVTPLCEADHSLGDGCAIEESPSPELIFAGDGEAIRGAMFEHARRLVLVSECSGLVTVNFQIDPQKRTWFKSAMVGLPRHHTVMELVTGLDLVALELDIAAGEKLAESLELVQPTGHAISAGVGVEGDHAHAAVEQLNVPPAPHDRVRFDSSVVKGGTICPDDYPLLMRITVRMALRHLALLTLDRALAETTITPVDTNIGTLRQVLGHFSFRAGQYDDGFAQRHLQA